VLLHRVSLLEADDFRLAESITEVSDGRVANLRWKASGEGYALGLEPPSPEMRRTGWPDRLPKPLSVIQPGQSVIIDWNGRFQASMFGSNRSFIYEQHRLAVACTVETPAPDLFLTLQPRKTFDFTTRIY